MKSSEVSAGVVLIVAPIGKDALLTAELLQKSAVSAEVCPDLVSAASRLDLNTNALLIAEEALVASEIPGLLDALGRQPAWSDVPVLIITGTASSEEVGIRILKTFGPKANITLLERPLRAVTLTSTLEVALRARRRQREVRELIEQRDTVLSSISDAFSAIDRDWRYTYVNERVAELAGLKRESLIGRNIWEVFPDAVGGEFYTLAHQAMETRRPAQAEFFHKPWGRWLDTRIYPTESGIVVFRGDVTERKTQELLVQERDAKLKENETLLRLAIEAADLGTFDFYPGTRELRYSQRMREIFGLDEKAKPTYDDFLASIHPDDLARVEAAVAAALEPENAGRYEIEYRVLDAHDGSERWVGVKGRVFFDEKQQPQRFIGTILDITERKTAELALQRAKQDAEAANRTKDRFLAMLSHELRTPLTPVLMTIAALERSPGIGDELRRDLDVIRRNVELEALLIDDLLDLTRIAHGKLELHNDAVDIHSQIAHALAISSGEIGAKQLNVTCNLDAAEHHCWADTARLQQVFWNVIKNAVKFTPAHGQVTVKTHNDAEHQIIVEISDSGVGIDPEVMPRIFNAFEQGSRTVTTKFGGLGLGLAISKSIIDLHHGSLIAKSEGAGRGATFCIVLRAMATSLLDQPQYPIDHPPPAAGTHRVLLVEDHDDTARVLRRMLEKSGYEVAVANTVAAARKLSAQRQFDLIVSDVGLPDGTGHDLMRELHSTKHLAGIALSGFGTEEDIAASRAAGFTEHLTKPVDWERLREAVEKVAAKKAGELSPT